MAKKQKKRREPDPSQGALEAAAEELKVAAFEHPVEYPIPERLQQPDATREDLFQAVAENMPTFAATAAELNRRHSRDLVLWDWELRVKFTYMQQLLGGALQLSVASLDGRALPDRIVQAVVRAFFSHGEPVQEMKKEVASPVNPNTRQFILAGQPLPRDLVE